MCQSVLLEKRKSWQTQSKKRRCVRVYLLLESIRPGSFGQASSVLLFLLDTIAITALTGQNALCNIIIIIYIDLQAQPEVIFHV